MNNKQKEILRFIKSYIKNNGYSPTNDEIKEAVGIKSKPMVNHYLNSLELLGKIKRDKYKHRNISVCKIKEDKLLKRISEIHKTISELYEELTELLLEQNYEIPNQK